jgi:hypothetical protein
MQPYPLGNGRAYTQCALSCVPPVDFDQSGQPPGIVHSPQMKSPVDSTRASHSIARRCFCNSGGSQKDLDDSVCASISESPDNDILL